MKLMVEDNFLPEEEFVILRDQIIGSKLPWNFNSNIVDSMDDASTCPGQFVHKVYDAGASSSQLYEYFIPMLENNLKSVLLMRIKINLHPRLPKPFYSQFHSDTEVDIGENITGQYLLSIPWQTSIFYINTNNGYTELESGEKVESVANRLVTFPSTILHRGVTQTDEQTRIVVNLNYSTLSNMDINWVNEQIRELL